MADDSIPQMNIETRPERRGGARRGAGRPRAYRTQLTVQVDNAHMKRINTIARLTGLSKAQVVNQMIGRGFAALDEYREQLKREREADRKPRRSKSRMG